ncbi:DUF2269 family protein [Noviherbaspirillum massiliense]|uniref:DUF2269 family protein n=1 Tax=Noviherbaspirillum massiliense TaxID=1465823 RepID=UPI00031AD9C1|nr:DUF2269 family protein [Noviherbaspirillum massiliense]
MSYPLLKTIHIFGVLLFLGNIIVSGFWKAWADRSRDIDVIRYASRMIIRTDMIFTIVGIVVLLGAGHAMAPAYGSVLEVPWIAWSYLLLAGSALIWLVVLVPVQLGQSRLLRRPAPDNIVPARYWLLARLWTLAGIIATLLPLPAVYLMVAKPG